MTCPNATEYKVSKQYNTIHAYISLKEGILSESIIESVEIQLMNLTLSKYIETTTEHVLIDDFLIIKIKMEEIPNKTLVRSFLKLVNEGRQTKANQAFTIIKKD